MKDVESAVSLFKGGFVCSQAILSTYGPGLGLDEETALKLSAGFGGGMGRMGDICGAVTGAFMVIGLKYGNAKAEESEAKEKNYATVREFAGRFGSRNGSIVCRNLLDCDISTAEGLALAREKNLFETICTKLVRDAAEILEELI